MACLKKVAFVGSFDPFHYGHFNVWRQLTNIFKAEEIFIVIAINSKKSSKNSLQERKQQILKFFTNQHLQINSNQILLCSKLFANFCLQHKITIFARGIRNNQDLAYEMNLQKQYLQLNSKLIGIYFFHK